MIIGKITDWEAERKAYSEWLCYWLSSLNGMEFDGMGDGEYKLAEDALLIVKTVNTYPPSMVLAEHHEYHADIHYVIEGEEWIGVARRSAINKPALDHPPIEDHIFFKDVYNEQFICVKAGEFIVLFPNDVHRPCCTSINGRGEVRKALLKVRI